MDFGPHPDGEVSLTPRAEQEFRRKVERVGGSEVNPDEAERCSAASRFWADCETILEAVIV